MEQNHETTLQGRSESSAQKSERRAIEFSDIVHRQVLVMRAAVVAWQREGAEAGMRWIANTLFGPGQLPSDEDITMGAQALFDKEVAEHEEFRSAHPVVKVEEEDQIRPDDNPEKWGAYFDGDERVTVHETEGEAVGEIMFKIDDEHEPGTEVTYCVAPMLNGKHILRKDNAQHIGDNLFEQINERVNDEMYAEEDPLDMTPEDRLALGKLVVDFICAHANVQWWTVDTKREHKRTYVAGSNDAPTVQHVPSDDTEGGAA